MNDIRSFRGPDAKAAFAAVKASLGPDAVILSAREVPGGLLRRPEVEVLATVGQPSAPPPPPKAPLPEPLPLRPRAPAERTPTPEARAPLLREERRLSALPTRETETAGPEAALAHEVLALRRSVEEARREMRIVSQRARSEVELYLRPAAAEAYGRLVGGGVEDALAEEVLRQALGSSSGGDSARALFDAATKLISQRLVPGRAPWLKGPPRAVALVGPTGVGKTTSLAKIAARALLDSRLRISLITVDTYRIGASEQLTRYGEIMGVPSFVARSKAELSQAITNSRGADLVLIDTAGRSTSEAVAQQAELLRSVPGIQLHLVISAATGWRDLAALADRYRSLAPEGLIVTKLDEAAAPGSVLSAATRLPSPILCVADGQRVPEDLHEARADDLLERVLASCRGVGSRQAHA